MALSRGRNPNAGFCLRQPELGVLRGAGVLTEFGVDPRRYHDTKPARTGTSPNAARTGALATNLRVRALGHKGAPPANRPLDGTPHGCLRAPTATARSSAKVPPNQPPLDLPAHDITEVMQKERDGAVVQRPALSCF